MRLRVSPDTYYVTIHPVPHPFRDQQLDDDIEALGDMKRRWMEAKVESSTVSSESGSWMPVTCGDLPSGYRTVVVCERVSHPQSCQ